MKKAIKNHANMDQKSMNNQSKIGQNRGLEGSFAHLGRLGRKRVAKMASKLGILGRLGASWEPLGPSWAEKGRQDGSKLAPKKRQNPSCGLPGPSWERLGSFMWWIFIPKWDEIVACYVGFHFGMDF